MLTLVRPMECETGRARSMVRSWRALPVDDRPVLRLVGVDRPVMGGRSPDADEVLTIAVDRLIDHAMAELTRERNSVRRRLAGG
jgi:hypothetical protein